MDLHDLGERAQGESRSITSWHSRSANKTSPRKRQDQSPQPSAHPISRRLRPTTQQVRPFEPRQRPLTHTIPCTRPSRKRPTALASTTTTAARAKQDGILGTQRAGSIDDFLEPHPFTFFFFDHHHIISIPLQPFFFSPYGSRCGQSLTLGANFLVLQVSFSLTNRLRLKYWRDRRRKGKNAHGR
jgi:hypothetical protein